MRQGLEPLSQLPLNSWALIISVFMLLIVVSKLIRPVYNLLAPKGGSVRMVGTHASLAENEAFMFRGDMKKMNLPDRSAITLKAGDSGVRVRVILREFGQQRNDTPMGYTDGIAFHKRQLAALLDTTEEDELPNEPVRMRLTLSRSANLFAHPDESIRITAWVTVAVTLLTSVFSIVVELVVP